ncbi:MAG: hypothetical protein BGN89_09950 [Alphaproteobacteria bacterium 64-6]|nr:MAG: hypothetical protein BGN89_09950 [Alphaproteobacteria bacterium 64-6]
MVVAVITVRMVQVAFDEVVNMITMRHGFVSAAGPMHMIRCVPGAAMVRRAPVGILVRDFDHVLIDVVAVHVMKMPVVQVVHVIAVVDGGVTALGAVHMRMMGMLGMLRARGGRHELPRRLNKTAQRPVAL